MDWVLLPLLYVRPRNELDCCQWLPFLEENYRVTVEELKRIEALKKQRGVLSVSLADIKFKLLNLHRELNQSASRADTNRRKVILNFIRKNNLSWENAHKWLLSQSKEEKVLCEHVFPAGEPLAVYAATIKEQLQPALVMFRGEVYHPDCTAKFLEIHALIVPNLEKLKECDTVVQDIAYMKKAKNFLKHQIQDAESFVLDFAPEPNTVPAPQLPQLPQPREPPEPPKAQAPQIPKQKKEKAIKKITLRYNDIPVFRPVTIKPFFDDLEEAAALNVNHAIVEPDIPFPNATQLAINMPVKTRCRKQAMPKSDVPKADEPNADAPKKRGPGRPRKVLKKPPPSAQLNREAGPSGSKPSGSKETVADK